MVFQNKDKYDQFRSDLYVAIDKRVSVSEFLDFDMQLFSLCYTNSSLMSYGASKWFVFILLSLVCLYAWKSLWLKMFLLFIKNCKCYWFHLESLVRTEKLSNILGYTNQLTDFYMMATLPFNELIRTSTFF